MIMSLIYFFIEDQTLFELLIKSNNLNLNIDFNINLDLEGLIDKKENKNKFSTKYKLIGVSTHAGSSSSSGHYTACCLADNGKYYYFSDTFVNEVNERTIYDNEPYLLFYKRLDSLDTFSKPY